MFQFQGEGESIVIERDQLQRLYRDVVIGAVHDMGMGDWIAVRDVRLWMGKDSFGTVCYLANWDDGWIVDLFNSIDELPQQIKRQLTRKCVELLRALSRAAEDGSFERESRPPMVTFPSAGFKPTEFEQGPMKYSEGKTKSILSNMSKGSHAKHGGWNKGVAVADRE